MAETDFRQLHQDLWKRTESYGITVREERLTDEMAGQFDGLSITMNSRYALDERCYYLVHALGSIVAWSVDPEHCRAVFEELDAARKQRGTDPERLERAIEAYCAFEEAASEYAVWLMAELGYAGVVPVYTNFARADLVALVTYHRTGVAPVWREFFVRWNEDVAAAKQQVRPYRARAIPAFRPVAFRRQTVIQEMDGKANI